MEQLKYYDKVTFKVGDEVLNYEVKMNHLDYLDGISNYEVFELLGMHTHEERREFASKIYGYKTEKGDWPVFKDQDYAAATELVKALHDLCNLHNIKLL